MPRKRNSGGGLRARERLRRSGLTRYTLANASSFLDPLGAYSLTQTPTYHFRRPIGAGDGNRTRLCSLGSCHSTDELHPQVPQRAEICAPRTDVCLSYPVFLAILNSGYLSTSHQALLGYRAPTGHASIYAASNCAKSRRSMGDESSRTECIDSSGMPQSTVAMPRRVVVKGPIVVPHGTSL